MALLNEVIEAYNRPLVTEDEIPDGDIDKAMIGMGHIVDCIKQELRKGKVTSYTFSGHANSFVPITKKLLEVFRLNGFTVSLSLAKISLPDVRYYNLEISGWA
jgi:hypothetical protein